MANVPDNKVTWFQLPIDDEERAWKFYNSVFGWTKEAVIKDEKMMGGINGELVSRKYVSEPRLVIHVPVIDDALEQIKRNGGTIVVDRTDIPQIAMVFATFKDTEGNLVNIVSNV